MALSSQSAMKPAFFVMMSVRPQSCPVVIISVENVLTLGKSGTRNNSLLLKLILSVFLLLDIAYAGLKLRLSFLQKGVRSSLHDTVKMSLSWGTVSNVPCAVDPVLVIQKHGTFSTSQTPGNVGKKWRQSFSTLFSTRGGPWILIPQSDPKSSFTVTLYTLKSFSSQIVLCSFLGWCLLSFQYLKYVFLVVSLLSQFLIRILAIPVPISTYP